MTKTSQTSELRNLEIKYIWKWNFQKTVQRAARFGVTGTRIDLMSACRMNLHPSKYSCEFGPRNHPRATSNKTKLMNRRLQFKSQNNRSRKLSTIPKQNTHSDSMGYWTRRQSKMTYSARLVLLLWKMFWRVGIRQSLPMDKLDRVRLLL